MAFTTAMLKNDSQLFGAYFNQSWILKASGHACIRVTVIVYVRVIISKFTFPNDYYESIPGTMWYYIYKDEHTGSQLSSHISAGWLSFFSLNKFFYLPTTTEMRTNNNNNKKNLKLSWLHITQRKIGFTQKSFKTFIVITFMYVHLLSQWTLSQMALFLLVRVRWKVWLWSLEE